MSATLPHNWKERPIGECIICHKDVYAVDVYEYMRTKRERNPAVMHKACGW